MRGLLAASGGHRAIHCPFHLFHSRGRGPILAGPQRRALALERHDVKGASEVKAIKLIEGLKKTLAQFCPQADDQFGQKRRNQYDNIPFES